MFFALFFAFVTPFKFTTYYILNQIKSDKYFGGVVLCLTEVAAIAVFLAQTTEYSFSF